MFKSLNLLIHKTPWWGLIAVGIGIFLSLALFAVPIQMIRLSDQAASPEEKRAIQREINQAVTNSGLSVAEGIVSRMKDRAQDPDRRRELERALGEIERARSEVLNATHNSVNEVRDAMREAAQDALNAAQESAQTALEAAQDARETIEGTRDEALQSLRSKGLDVSATERSFVELLREAKEKEAAAQSALDKIAKSRDELQNATPPQAPPTSVTVTVPSVSSDKPAIQIGVPVPLPPQPPLPPQLRDTIHAAVAGDMWRVGIGSVLILAFIPLFVMLLIAKFFIDRSHRALAFAEKKEEEAQVSDMRRQMTEARLQALQAQVEPHFLYNTLANVQALTELDPPAASRLVEHLIQYLRASLPKMRESTSTVGQEVERVRAYLNILKMRMVERLEFGIHIHPDLLNLPFPPMMLPSLVENAIKHGLEPKREGGRIDVVATRVQRDGAARIVLEVKDTGAGLSANASESGGGVGLSNLRERLQALYGTQGRFSLEPNQPSGVVATIDIPAEQAVVGAASSTNGLPANMSTTAVAVGSRTVWGRMWGATRRTHGIWATIVSRTFMALMLVLVVGFFAALIGLYSGAFPVQINDFQLEGLEGMAVGSLGLLVAFGALALVIGILVVVLYGMGFLFAGLLLFVPTVILISLFPVMSPFVLIGLGVYWLWRRNRRKAHNLQSDSHRNGK